MARRPRRPAPRSSPSGRGQFGRDRRRTRVGGERRVVGELQRVVPARELARGARQVIGAVHERANRRLPPRAARRAGQPQDPHARQPGHGPRHLSKRVAIEAVAPGRGQIEQHHAGEPSTGTAPRTRARTRRPSRRPRPRTAASRRRPRAASAAPAARAPDRTARRRARSIPGPRGRSCRRASSGSSAACTRVQLADRPAAGASSTTIGAPCPVQWICSWWPPTSISRPGWGNRRRSSDVVTP